MKDIERALELVRQIHDGDSESPIKTELQLRQALALGEGIRELTPVEQSEFFDAPASAPAGVRVFEEDRISARQRAQANYAALAVLRFPRAAWIVDVASVFGWVVAGLGSVSTNIDDEFVEVGLSIELIHANGYATGEVRIELGDELVILWSADPDTMPWFALPNWLALLDILGDAAIEADAFQARGGAAQCSSDHDEPEEVF